MHNYSDIGFYVLFGTMNNKITTSKYEKEIAWLDRGHVHSREPPHVCSFI